MIAAVLAVVVGCLLPPVDAPVSRGFEAPACRWCPGHRGLEYASAPGQAVRAAAAGTVTFSGAVAGAQYLVVLHDDGLRATYGGVVDPTVGAGQRVVGGQRIGRTVGRLHFGLRDGETYVDPAPMLAFRAGRPRLVPIDGVGRRPGRGGPLGCPAEVRVRGRPR